MTWMKWPFHAKTHLKIQKFSKFRKKKTSSKLTWCKGGYYCVKKIKLIIIFCFVRCFNPPLTLKAFPCSVFWSKLSTYLVCIENSISFYLTLDRETKSKLTQSIFRSIMRIKLHNLAGLGSIKRGVALIIATDNMMDTAPLLLWESGGSSSHWSPWPSFRSAGGLQGIRQQSNP